MITKSLQRLGVLGQSGTASGYLVDLVGPIVDSLHHQLRKDGLAPYATSAFPEWAQEPFAKAMEEEAGPYFGKPRAGMRAAGEREMAKQMQAKRHPRPIRFKDF